MTIARRNILGLIAASAATALAGCGGGDGPSSRSVRVLNLNPDFPSVQVEIRNVVVAPVLQFKGLTGPIEVAFGTYTLGIRDRTGALNPVFFDNIQANENSPSIEVFYRDFNTVGLQGLLDSSPPVVINYFDSTEQLVVELEDGLGSLQRQVMAFKDSVAQVSPSAQCRLRVFRFSDGTLVYDSGPVLRPRAILLYPLFSAFPFDPVFGRVGAVALNYPGANAAVQDWPTI